MQIGDRAADRRSQEPVRGLQRRARTVAILALAVPPEGGRDGDPWFVDVEVWGPPAEACAPGTWAKGRRVAVSGRLALDRWTSEDSTARRAHRIVAANVEFIDHPAATESVA